MSNGFNWSSGMMAHLGRHGPGRMAMLAAALASTLVGAAAPALDLTMEKFDGPAGSAYARIVGAFKTDADTFVKAANAAATAKGAVGTCFGTQLDGQFSSPDVQRRVEKATIYIAARDGDGKTIDGGTGALVRGSGGRVLTALHVSEIGRQKGIERFQAFDSTGKLLGDVRQVAAGRSADDGTIDSAYNNHADLAVMQVTPADSTSRAALDDIEGIDLAPAQFVRNEIAIFGSGTRAGVWFGHSGSSLLDRDGRIHAVLNTGRPLFWNAGGEIHLKANSMDSVSKGSAPLRDVTMPRASMAGFAGLGDAGILAALGQASEGVVVSPEVPEDIRGSAPPVLIVAGYPRGVCLTSMGHMSMDMDFLGVGLDMAKNELSDETGKALDLGRSVTRDIAWSTGMGTAPKTAVSEAPAMPAAAFIADPPGSSGRPMALGDAANWRDGVGAWHATGALGDYRIRTGSEGTILAFGAAGGRTAEVAVGTVPPVSRKDSDAFGRLCGLAARHEAVLVAALHAVPEMHAAFSASALSGGRTMEVCKLDGKVGLPPGCGPAVRILDPDGNVTEEAYLFSGTRLGKDFEAARVMFEEEFPEVAARRAEPAPG